MKEIEVKCWSRLKNIDSDEFSLKTNKKSKLYKCFTVTQFTVKCVLSYSKIIISPFTILFIKFCLEGEMVYAHI
jgi:hypothetical protein